MVAVRIVDGVVLTGPECAALAPLLERVAQTDPGAITARAPLGRHVLHEVNEAARAEHRRRAEAQYQEGLVSVAELAKLTGWSARTIRRWAASGRLPAERRGGRCAVGRAA